jgi:hypothetical protein
MNLSSQRIQEFVTSTPQYSWLKHLGYFKYSMGTIVALAILGIFSASKLEAIRSDYEMKINHTLGDEVYDDDKANKTPSKHYRLLTESEFNAFAKDGKFDAVIRIYDPSVITSDVLPTTADDNDIPGCIEISAPSIVKDPAILQDVYEIPKHSVIYILGGDHNLRSQVVDALHNDWYDRSSIYMSV